MNKKLWIVLGQAVFFLYLNTFASAQGFVYNSHERRDPFVPPYLQNKIEPQPKDNQNKQPTDYGTIVLQAIVYDPVGESAVIINNQIMKVDDKTDFFIVKDITRNEAIIEVLGEIKVLRLRDDKGDENAN
jgi:hypothetical protein